MKNLKAWFASPAGKRFFNIFYSLGAAIVVIGAMFKVIHFPGANVVFMTGMIIEALVFALSAFDTSSYDNTPVTVARDVEVNDSENNVVSDNNKSTSKLTNNVNSDLENKYSKGGSVNNTTQGKTTVGSQANTNSSPFNQGAATGSIPNIANNAGSASPSVIVVGGGGSSSQDSTGANNPQIGNSTPSGITNINTGGDSVVNNINADGYSQSVNDAAQNLEDFSKTIQSLNETSQTLLDTYKQMADAQSVTETLNSVRYINDSLARIKNLYDGAIGDSYMFKEEMSKMTRNIEALNQVYSRLLQAMTNNPNSGHNPPY